MRRIKWNKFCDLFFTPSLVEMLHFYLAKGLWTCLTQFCSCQRRRGRLVATHVITSGRGHAAQGCSSCHPHTVDVFTQSRSPQGILVTEGFAKAKRSQLLLPDLGTALSLRIMTLLPTESSPTSPTPTLHPHPSEGTSTTSSSLPPL